MTLFVKVLLGFLDFDDVFGQNILHLLLANLNLGGLGNFPLPEVVGDDLLKEVMVFKWNCSSGFQEGRFFNLFFELV